MPDRIVEIAASGGDYTSFATAEAGEADFQAGEDNIVFRRTDLVRDSSGFTVSGYTTTSAHWVIFECNADVQHDGTRLSGAGVVANAAWDNLITISISYVKLFRLELRNSGDYGTCIRANGSDDNVIDSCLIHNSHIGVHGSDGSGRRIIANSIVYNCAETGLRKGDPFYSYFNTVLNNTVYGEELTGTCAIKNTYSGGNLTYDYVNSGTSTFTTSASSDGSESTTTISLSACEFTSSTAGSENANIGSGSDLIGAGTGLSADAVYPITVDCFGTSRASTPCIGAVEYVASVTGNTYYYQQQQM